MSEDHADKIDLIGRVKELERQHFEEQSVADLLHELLAVEYQLMMYWHSYFKMKGIVTTNEDGQFKGYYEQYMRHKNWHEDPPR